MSKLQELVQGAYMVCKPCGAEYGRSTTTEDRFRKSSHVGHCDICDRDDILVIEFKDFGYERELKPRETFKKDILKDE